MVVRQALGAALPMAGTGCAVAAAMLGRIAQERGAPFDARSLTEDYEMGLTIAAMGGRGVFARYRDAGGALIAVRAYFPFTLAAAARQKARWMVGIALAGWDRTGWARGRDLADHWMRMRDRRAPLAVCVLAAAYVGLIALAADDVLRAIAGMPGAVSIPEWLLAANLGLLGWRLAMRVGFTTREHGWREGVLAVPRFVIGNAVALAAGPRALARYLPILVGRMPAWDKTAHAFPMPPARPPGADAPPGPTGAPSLPDGLAPA